MGRYVTRSIQQNVRGRIQVAHPTPFHSTRIKSVLLLVGTRISAPGQHSRGSASAEPGLGRVHQLSAFKTLKPRAGLEGDSSVDREWISHSCRRMMAQTQMQFK